MVGIGSKGWRVMSENFHGKHMTGTCRSSLTYNEEEDLLLVVVCMLLGVSDSWMGSAGDKNSRTQSSSLGLHASSWYMQFTEISYVLVFFLKDVYNLLPVKKGWDSLLGGKNLQKQYRRGKKEACRVGEEKDIKGELANVLAQNWDAIRSQNNEEQIEVFVSLLFPVGQKGKNNVSLLVYVDSRDGENRRVVLVRCAMMRRIYYMLLGVSDSWMGSAGDKNVIRDAQREGRQRSISATLLFLLCIFVPRRSRLC
ncbi:hypothetical protein DKX38_008597 [Salix brachista]|uniref:Uncharacterized protein n=1 Tax=Salix brachista TaxID=2182728 RepID=A0A5N5MRZ4_9ROSI|nr:hypothetical protein DKX38_008597 [Salix brachista]